MGRTTRGYALVICGFAAAGCAALLPLIQGGVNPHTLYLALHFSARTAGVVFALALMTQAACRHRFTWGEENTRFAWGAFAAALSAHMATILFAATRGFYAGQTLGHLAVAFVTGGLVYVGVAAFAIRQFAAAPIRSRWWRVPVVFAWLIFFFAMLGDMRRGSWFATALATALGASAAALLVARKSPVHTPPASAR